MMPRLRTVPAVLFVADLVALIVALVSACVLRNWMGTDLPDGYYLRLVPFMVFFPLFYAMLGTYNLVLRPPHEELKLLSISTSVGFAVIALLLFFGQKGQDYSRLVLLIAWAGALLLVPLFRTTARRICAARDWWGHPVLLFASKAEGEEAARVFALHRERGLVPCAVVTVEPCDASWREKDAMHPHLLLNGDEAEAVMYSVKAAYPDAYVLILGESLPQESIKELVLLAGAHFKHVLISLDIFWLQQFSLRVSSIACGPVLILKQNLLDPFRMRMKRLLDLFLCFLGIGFLLVLVPLIALCIRIDSKGPAFFRQRRIGRDGKTIQVLKFRTMVHNAPEILKTLLAQDPELRKEWQATQKLTDDPRLTRVGRFLRHTSLDELPQVFNVLKGEMSLVGPRPIVESEIERYGEDYELYTRVRPGITGLWQISGRNDVSYEYRVRLDKQYVYNWSVWLDIYIIIKTFPALLSGKGAY